MNLRSDRAFVILAAALMCLPAAFAPPPIRAQASSNSSSSSSQSMSSSSQPAPPVYVQETTPSLVNPAGPTISLISSETVFIVASALNACGYNQGLEQSEPVRGEVRAEINQALAKSADARTKRDALCLFMTQHRLTGAARDISQYISLALYLTPPPHMELTAKPEEMPRDANEVMNVLPLLKAFSTAVDLPGIWLTVHNIYDKEAEQLHDPLTHMIVSTNLYLKMPAETSVGRRFIVIIAPMLSPRLVNARIYGSDYVVVVSPAKGKIPMADVRHTYLHYVIDPLLLSPTNDIRDLNPVLRAIQDAPLPDRYRTSTVALTIECLIKAIEARTMDTGIPEYKIPAGVNRSQLPRYEHQLHIYQEKVAAVRKAAVAHDMAQGFVLTQYFYNQLIQFEKGPASLNAAIGRMVYSMDVNQQVHRARQIQFDTQADEDVLQRSQPRKLTGLDLAEAHLANGDVADARAMAEEVLADHSNTPAAIAKRARADFILARVAVMSGHPQLAIEDFQKTLATSKENRQLAWSHIYLGRILDLECNRPAALAEYKKAMAVRDWQQDTRLAAEQGLKTAFTVKGHSCAEDATDDSAEPASVKQGSQPSGQNRTDTPQ